MATERVCLPAVTGLVDHLRSTGTGQYKLDKLTELGKCCNSLDEFLEMAPNNVPAATMQKVDEYIAGQVAPEAEAAKKGKKAGVSWSETRRGKMLKEKSEQAVKVQEEGPAASHIETRDNTQSSVPDHTVLIESKAPVLKEGAGKAKPLGADVQVPKGESPVDNDEAEAGEEAEGAEEESEVHDLNADDAKDTISRMRSRDKLEAIVVNDKRKSVQEAAQKRLDELDAG